MKIWDIESHECLSTLSEHTTHAVSVAWSPDGYKIASGSYDNTIKIWDIETSLCLSTLSGHLDIVLSVAWSPLGQEIVSGSFDSTIKIWNISNFCVPYSHFNKFQFLD